MLAAAEAEYELGDAATVALTAGVGGAKAEVAGA